VTITPQQRAVLRRLARVGPALPEEVQELAAMTRNEWAAMIEELRGKDWIKGDDRQLETTTLGYLKAWQE